MTRPAACTIVARNYLAQARVLFASFREHHPDIEFVTLVVDALPTDEAITGVGTVVMPGDLDLDTAELHTMMAIYDVMEFSTSLKPALLMHLLRSGATAALYFDPDIRVFAPMHDVFEAAAESGIVLTPHVLHPFPDDDMIVSERMVMLAGIFNLGFVGVGSSGYRFLAWWNDKLSRHAISDPSRALFTDQRWIDWVPSLFPHRILRDPGLNVAHWNLHERHIDGTDGTWSVQGHPLRFLHFSGYDPHSPWLLSKHTRENPRVVLSSDVPLQTLCDDYATALLAAGYDELRALGYRYATTPAGVRLGPGIRRLVRSVDSGEVPSASPMPDPFGIDSAFSEWLVTPGLGDRLAPLTPLEVGVWLSRIDLQTAFPGALAESGQAYRDWFAHDPEAQSQLTHAIGTLPLADRRAEADKPTAPIGHPTARWTLLDLTVPNTEEHEIGTRIAEALLRSGASVTLVDPGTSILPAPGSSERPRRLADLVTTRRLIVLLGATQRLPSDLTLVLARPGTVCVGVVLGSTQTVAQSDLLAAGWASLWVVGEATADRVRTGAAALQVHAIAYPADPVVEETRSLPVPGHRDDALVVLHSSPFDTAAARAAQVAALIGGARDAGKALRVVLDESDLAPAEREHLRWLLRGHADVRQVEPSRGERADALVHLTTDSGAALCAVRAQAEGTPVVAIDGPSSPWSTTAETASLVPATAEGFDQAHAVRALGALLRSPALRERIATRARDDLTLRFSVAEIATDYRALLTALEPGGGT